MTHPQHRPFPALTPAQRYFFDVHGYVIVPGVLTEEECGAMRDDLHRLKRDLLAIPDPDRRVIDHAYFQHDMPHHHYIGAIGQSRRYPAILAYVTHPETWAWKRKSSVDRRIF
ncbi:MAG: phytanoyl-CoA dioxygenase family protein [candidate division Zixibacteria bacterium]|nr:phytanoyl-CoA dioxygenase family protein [candidate division Zixibacteria bacterium]